MDMNPKLQETTLLLDNLSGNEQQIVDLLGENADFKKYRFQLYEAGQLEGACFYMDGLADTSKIDASIEAITTYSKRIGDAGDPGTNFAALLESHFITKTIVSTLDLAVQGLLSGKTLFLVGREAFLVNTTGWKERSVDEPSTENVVRGSREGFVENIIVNSSLIRRRIRDPLLCIEFMSIGTRTKTAIHIVYLRGIAKEGLVEEVKQRLGKIQIDAILESGYIEELIEDAPYSPFNTVQVTERPDKVAANILEGRVGILVDNTPFALIVPTFFWDYIRASDDYYTGMWVSSFLRWVRLTGLLISFGLSSVYVMLVSFHQEMIPSGLALTIASGREVVPFPVLVEALLMEMVFELMREAGLRMPKPIGQAVSIVGSLVMGQAAVQAGLVSPFMVIVVAITGIASFAIPNYASAFSIRLLRFPLLLASGTIGLLGFSAVFYTILLHIFSLRSFGESYFSPASPFRPSEQKDLLIRVPWRLMKKRPAMASGDPQREGEHSMPHTPSSDHTNKKKGTFIWNPFRQRKN